MNDQLEAELRKVLALHAAQVPTSAVERLRRVDYRPRTRRHWPLTISALGAASGTAAVVSVVVVGGSQAAFAGWSAKPTAPTDAQSAATQDNCQARLATLPGAAGQGSWSQVMTDVRGPYTFAIYENGSSLGSCFTGPSFTSVSFTSGNTSGGGMSVSGSSSGSGTGGESSSSMGVQSPGGGIEHLAVNHLSLAGNGAYTVVDGRLESTVSAVTLVLSDGQDVTATTSNGWFVAWWPGNQDVTAAQITTAAGKATEPLDVPSQAPPPPATKGAPNSGSSGAQSSSSGGAVGGPSTNTKSSNGAGAEGGPSTNTKSSNSGGAEGGPSTNTQGANGGGAVVGPSTNAHGSGSNSGVAPPPPPLPGSSS
jgi:hypothetical protein